MHLHAMIVVDEDATLELQAKTVKVSTAAKRAFGDPALIPPVYFKSIEQVASSQGFGHSLPSEELFLKKRDSVLEKLDSPKSPPAKTFFAPPKPELTRQIKPGPVPIPCTRE